MWCEFTRSSEVRRSDHPLEFVEGRSKGEPRTCIAPEFVVASPQVLDESMASDYDACRSVLFQSAHRAEPGLESPTIGFDSVMARRRLRRGLPTMAPDGGAHDRLARRRQPPAGQIPWRGEERTRSVSAHCRHQPQTTGEPRTDPRWRMGTRGIEAESAYVGAPMQPTRAINARSEQPRPTPETKITRRTPPDTANAGCSTVS
jgi:hypothetical protein